VLSFVLVSTSVLFWAIFLLPFFGHGSYILQQVENNWKNYFFFCTIIRTAVIPITVVVIINTLRAQFATSFEIKFYWIFFSTLNYNFLKDILVITSVIHQSGSGCKRYYS
jgi:hypothetical protein